MVVRPVTENEQLSDDSVTPGRKVGKKENVPKDWNLVVFMEKFETEKSVNIWPEDKHGTEERYRENGPKDYKERVFTDDLSTIAPGVSPSIEPNKSNQAPVTMERQTVAQKLTGIASKTIIVTLLVYFLSFFAVLGISVHQWIISANYSNRIVESATDAQLVETVLGVKEFLQNVGDLSTDRITDFTLTSIPILITALAIPIINHLINQKKE